MSKIGKGLRNAFSALIIAIWGGGRVSEARPIAARRLQECMPLISGLRLPRRRVLEQGLGVSRAATAPRAISVPILLTNVPKNLTCYTVGRMGSSMQSGEFSRHAYCAHAKSPCFTPSMDPR